MLPHGLGNVMSTEFFLRVMCETYRLTLDAVEEQNLKPRNERCNTVQVDDGERLKPSITEKARGCSFS